MKQTASPDKSMRLIRMPHWYESTMSAFDSLIMRRLMLWMIVVMLGFWSVSYGDVVSREVSTEYSWSHLEQYDVLVSGYFSAPEVDGSILKYQSRNIINVTFKIREIFKAPKIPPEFSIAFSEHTFFSDHWNKRITALENEAEIAGSKQNSRENTNQFEILSVKRQLEGEQLDRLLKGIGTLHFNTKYIVGLNRFRPEIVPNYENSDQPREVVVIDPAHSPGVLTFLEKLRKMRTTP